MYDYKTRPQEAARIDAQRGIREASERLALWKHPRIFLCSHAPSIRNCYFLGGAQSLSIGNTGGGTLNWTAGSRCFAVERPARKRAALTAV